MTNLSNQPLSKIHLNARRGILKLDDYRMARRNLAEWSRIANNFQAVLIECCTTRLVIGSQSLRIATFSSLKSNLTATEAAQVISATPSLPDLTTD